MSLFIVREKSDIIFFKIHFPTVNMANFLLSKRNVYATFLRYGCTFICFPNSLLVVMATHHLIFYPPFFLFDWNAFRYGFEPFVTTMLSDRDVNPFCENAFRYGREPFLTGTLINRDEKLSGIKVNNIPLWFDDWNIWSFYYLPYCFLYICLYVKFQILLKWYAIINQNQMSM